MEPNSPPLPVEAALLDFQRSPGKYRLTQQQPALLFASIKEVLQLAGGRAADGSPGAVQQDVQKAAAFFIRASLLSIGSDHYSLLGLERATDTAAIKDHYRLMMRLI